MRWTPTGFAVALGLICAATPVVAQDANPAEPLVASSGCEHCIAGPSLRTQMLLPAADTGRPRAIQYSDAYGVRLTIHRIGSYAILPLFAAEYFLGEKLLTDERNNVNLRESSLVGVHSAVAASLGVIFTINTVTGLWNLIESRHDPAGRARRWVHSIAMLIADAGFVLTAQSAGEARRTDAAAVKHRNLAIGSISIATVASVMMWIWK